MDRKCNATKADNDHNKKPIDISNMAFNGRANSENWIDDNGISSVDEILSNVKKSGTRLIKM